MAVAVVFAIVGYLLASQLQSVRVNTQEDAATAGRLETFSGGKATDQETRATIARTWNETGVLIDPHTAVAKTVLDATEPEGRVGVVLSTASPYKFSAEVLRALDPAATFADGFKAMDRLAALTHTQPPAQLSGLRSLPVRFTQVVEKERMADAVRSLLG